MKSFDEKLLRLKQAIGVTEDQVVAAALGMSKAALAQRKKRDAFPDDKVAALALARPEWRIDVQQVLTGKTRHQVAIEAAAGVVHASRHAPLPAEDRPSPVYSRQSEDPTGIDLTPSERRYLAALRQCRPVDRSALTHLAESLAIAGAADARPKHGRG